MPVADQLRQEIETYAQNRGRLVGEHPRRYVLIRGTTIVGHYANERDAVAEGYRRFGNVPFLVKRLVPVDEPANFLSGHVRV